MKKTPLNSEKRTSQTESRPHPIPEDSDEVTQVAAVRPQELSPSSSPQSGIVNHITINGEMSGDIGFQKNELVPLSPHPESTAARAFPAPNRYPSHTHSPTKQKGRDRD